MKQSKRAEEVALKAYPVVMGTLIPTTDDEPEVKQDCNKFLREACKNGYEQAEKDLGWISVKDRLPEKDGWYFTCVEMSGVPQCVGLSHFETYSGQWDDDDDSVELVDYWMEIPALPKEEKK